MIKVRLSDSDPTILAFDGEILECFFIDGSRRFHISHIEGVQFEPNSKGRVLLTIKLKHEPLLLWVDAAGVAKVRELVAEMQKGMGSIKV